MSRVLTKLAVSLHPFNPCVEGYITDVVKFLQYRIGADRIKSVILFGSMAYNQGCKISDVDLLVIVDDSVSIKTIAGFKGYLNAIEIKHGFAKYPTNIISKILRIVETTTGMFRSFFIARHSDWLKGDFAAIFGTNRLVTKLLAPDMIVLNSVIAGGRTLYGDPVYLQKTFPIAAGQIIKSLMMDLTIAIGTLAILPLNPQNMKYVLESFKWALRGGYFYLLKKAAPLTTVQRTFIRLGFSAQMIRVMNLLRQNLRPHIKLALALPFQIVKIHALSLRNKR
jgi:predicted nucleotidyltransferase